VLLTTERLVVVRRWRDADLDAYAALNADPEVMTFLGAPLSRAESDSFARYGEGWFEREGLGLLPVVRKADGVCLGMCGMHRHRWYPDEVETGWRFARHAWGHGYATEAARAWLRRGFTELGLPGVISISAPGNRASQAVMRRLGMRPREEAVHTDRAGREVHVVVHALTVGEASATGER
jgi:RimJ/RimL family protein N-acetyltransferase